MNPLKISLKAGRFQNNPRQFDVHYAKETPREVGVNLTNGYNGHLTSREAGSVGGQMVKKMIPVRTANYIRKDRTAVGHEIEVRYIAGITV